MTYHVGNPGPGLVQAQKCGRLKPVNGSQLSSLLIIGSQQQQCIDKQRIKKKKLAQLPFH